MPILYSIDETKNLIVIVVSGRTNPLDWGKTLLCLKRDSKRRETMNVYFDFRKHESTVPTAAIAGLSGRIREKHTPIKWAFLISQEASEQKVLMLAEKLASKNISVKAFYGGSEAVEWLQDDTNISA